MISNYSQSRSNDRKIHKIGWKLTFNVKKIVSNSSNLLKKWHKLVENVQKRWFFSIFCQVDFFIIFHNFIIFLQFLFYFTKFHRFCVSFRVILNQIFVFFEPFFDVVLAVALFSYDFVRKVGSFRGFWMIFEKFSNNFSIFHWILSIFLRC